jgi:hypothetical protein
MRSVSAFHPNVLAELSSTFFDSPAGIGPPGPASETSGRPIRMPDSDGECEKKYKETFTCRNPRQSVGNNDDPPAARTGGFLRMPGFGFGRDKAALAPPSPIQTVTVGSGFAPDPPAFRRRRRERRVAD